MPKLPVPKKLPRHHPFAIARHLRGFSLIELLITLAIMGLLAAVAYPQYTSVVQKSRRADGRMALLQEAQTLERCKASSYSYASCSLGSSSSPEGHYSITLQTTASTYVISAAGSGAQANDTECSTMTLNQQGVQTPDTGTSDCWPD